MNQSLISYMDEKKKNLPNFDGRPLTLRDQSITKHQLQDSH